MYALANAILLCRQHCKHIKKELEHTQTRPTPGGEGDKERERESALRTKAGEWREATEKKELASYHGLHSAGQYFFYY
jgi:hypothetical protein